MAKLTERIQVKVKSENGDDGKRRIAIQVECEAARFLLPELLASEGAIEPLEKQLKACCTETVVAFLTAGKTVLRKLRAEKKSSSQQVLAKEAA